MVVVPTIGANSVDEVWVDTGPGLDRVLFITAGEVVEIWHEFAHAPTRIGEVHRLRIDHLFAAQGRAMARLVDGAHVSVRLSPRDKVAVGQMIDVTITAAPRQQKPWQAVMGARIAGAYLVLIPGGAGVQLSRALKTTSTPPSGTPAAPSFVQSLQDELARQLPDGYGVIVRRGAANSDVSAVLAECGNLCASWALQARPDRGAGRLYDGGAVIQNAGFHAPTARVCAGDDAVSADRFDDAYEAAIQAATAQPVLVPAGGQLWFEPTQALTAIDLDSGGGSLSGLVQAAPAVIARQLRLRGLTGLIAIDVPRMAAKAAKNFTAALQAAFAADPRYPEILGRSRGGVLECRIAHARPELADALSDSAAFEALMGLRAIQHRPQLAMPQLTVSPKMANWLAGPGAPALAALDRDVRLVVSSAADRATIVERP
jgi:Ribonuclease G/E